MRIFILGAPGSGKGTQARLLAIKYNIPHISTGNMLRNIIKTKSIIGKKIEILINSGKLVTDTLVIEIIKKRIKQKDCKNGFILDGYPRTLKQIYAIKNKNISIDFIFEILVPTNIILSRIIGRKTHISSGRIYHSLFNPPKQKNKDDITGEPLIVRPDDNENIIRNRLNEYYRQTIPLIEYYRKKNNIDNVFFFKINGNQSVINVYTEIISILNKNEN